MTWLIVCRAIQGLGGGGIIQLVQIIISDIVSLQECVLSCQMFVRLINHCVVEVNMVAS